MLVEIQVGGGSGWGYSQLLKVLNANKTSNNIIVNLTASGTDWQGAKGDLSTKSCKIFLPKKSKIRINAVWSSVDT
jgi:hypothetical protein